MTEASHQMSSNPLPPGSRSPGTVGVGTGVEIGIMDDNGNLIQSNNDTLYTSQGTNSWLMGEVIVTSGPLGPVQEINATTIAYLHVLITVDQSPNDCAYNQTKKRIQNRNGWMNDKYNYSTKLLN